MGLVFHPPQPRFIPTPRLRIDSSHPLAHGLIACYVPGISFGINLVGTGGDLTLSGSYTTILSNVDGPAIDLTAGRLSTTAPSLFKTFTNGCALFWRGQLVAAGNNYPMLIGITYDNAGTSPFSVASIHKRAFGGVDIGAQTNSAGTEVFAGTYTASANVQESVGGSFTVGGNAELFVGGISRATAAMASAPNSTATSTLGFGIDLIATADDPNQRPNVAYIWNRPLTAAEQARLAFDPYCLLIPAEGEMPIMSVYPTLASGSGGGSAYVGRIFPYRARRQIPV